MQSQNKGLVWLKCVWHLPVLFSVFEVIGEGEPQGCVIRPQRPQTQPWNVKYTLGPLVLELKDFFIRVLVNPNEVSLLLLFHTVICSHNENKTTRMEIAYKGQNFLESWERQQHSRNLLTLFWQDKKLLFCPPFSWRKNGIFMQSSLLTDKRRVACLARDSLLWTTPTHICGNLIWNLCSDFSTK